MSWFLILQRALFGLNLINETAVEITDYWDEPGLYSLSRIKTKERERIGLSVLFYHSSRWAGTVNEGSRFRRGETILIPAGIEHLGLLGALDLFVASYKNMEA